MKTILHPDYWAEIPEGECLIGFTLEQRQLIWSWVKERADYAKRSEAEKQAMDAILEKAAHDEKITDAEARLFGFSAFLFPSLSYYPPRIVHLKRFYISRFPITGEQYYLFKHGRNAKDVPGVFEEPETQRTKSGAIIYSRCHAEVQYDTALHFCEQLGGRLPTKEEWEKAARGEEGRLYPWGNYWDESKGFFYYGQTRTKQCGGGKPPVDAYPQGVSPYGVWSMAGYISELVVTTEPGYPVLEFKGEKIAIGKKGCHPRESRKEIAYLDHLLAQNGYGDWVGFRPVLDEWPQRLWGGVEVG